MKALLSTAQLLRITTSAAGSIVASVTAVDKTGTGPASYSYATVKPAHVVVTTATTTTIIAGVASTERAIEELTVSNSHATVSNTIVIEDFDGTNAAPVWAGTLAPGLNAHTKAAEIEQELYVAWVKSGRSSGDKIGRAHV